jgi:hypothetical protein
MEPALRQALTAVRDECAALLRDPEEAELRRLVRLLALAGRLVNAVQSELARLRANPAVEPDDRRCG